jgi:hypothetical protein
MRISNYLTPLLLFPFILSACQFLDNNSAEKVVIEKKNNFLTDEEIADGWKLMFDGETTSGWRGFNQPVINKGWTVKDECLYSSGKGGDIGGDIISDEMFEDFDLSLEWAISEAGNSGILFHVLEGDYPAVYVTGPEYQLLDDAGYPDKLEEWQKTGANYAMHTVKSKTLKPVGEFNSSRIRVKDSHVTHWLNDEKIIEYDLWTDDWKNRVQESKWKDYPFYGLARKGHISLQDHGSIIKFRNIKIKDLTDKGEKLFNGQNLDGWTIHGTEKWYTENGEMICESGPDKAYGYLATNKQYNDFILRLEFKQESNGNSGVFFRSSLDGTKISGWQVEVAPKGNDSGGIYESYGRGWLYQIPEDRENILKEGDWNEMVIQVQGSRVMTWLNQELMTDLEDEKIGEASGVVALQIHDGGGVKVKWRNIYLREI